MNFFDKISQSFNDLLAMAARHQVWAQLLDSAVWILLSYAGSIIFMLVAGLILIRTTRWGGQFWSIAKPHVDPRNSIKPLLLFLLLLFLTLFGVRLEVLFSNWYNSMYSSLQGKNESSFWLLMAVFAFLATIHVARVLYTSYINSKFSIHLRESLNTHFLSRWLHKDNYYRMGFLKNNIDNPDQRIQVDIQNFVDTSLTLLLGCISNLVSAIAFSLILWNLAGPMKIFGVTLPHAMVFFLFMYVFLVTLIAFWIGRPLIQLNFLQERITANYRYALIRVREYAESIAMYAGSQLEKSKLFGKFRQVVSIYWKLVFRGLKFEGFNLVASQTAAVFPFIIQATRFFSGQLTLGDLVQTAQAFGTLQGNLSFFRQSYDSYASLKATLNRLTDFQEYMSQSEALPKPSVSHIGQGLALDDVTVNKPDGETLIRNLTLQLHKGDHLLIMGNSGSGKTTLLRTMAGLWPYSEGTIAHPQDKTLFMSQKPYLPQGNLLDVLYYPKHVPEDSSTADQSVADVLKLICLPQLVDRIHTQANWSEILSVGEQQRLAFGRLLLSRPDVIFLDEATSAMDEGLEYQMYSLLEQQLPDAVIVSVGHRSTLRAHHSQQLTLKGSGDVQIENIKDAAKPVAGQD